MLAGNYQVADVLMLVGNVAPIALYFLALGLVNSHSRPCLITSRSDFIVLTIVLVPVLLWPIPVFLPAGMGWVVLVGLLLTAVVFFRLLPMAHAGFVIYNISRPCGRALLEKSLQRLNMSGRWQEHTWRAADGTIAIHLSGFALLRNVTLHIDAHGAEAARRVDALEAELRRRMERVHQLPSTMGACLVLIGLALMILPMWMVGRHIHDLVDAMSHLLG